MIRKTSDWIDVSIPIHNDMVCWPGDPPIHLKRRHDMEQGDANNVSEISMGLHTGTHMDAPLHYLRTGTSIDRIPPDAIIGRARVIEIRDDEVIRVEELRRYRIRRGERILFKTQNSKRCWQTDKFIKDFVFITEESARFLVGRSVRTIGVDYLSVGEYKQGAETHRILLEAGFWLIEGLDLSKVAPGSYDLLCLPLKIMGGEGSPVRAMLRPVTKRRHA